VYRIVHYFNTNPTLNCNPNFHLILPSKLLSPKYQLPIRYFTDRTPFFIDCQPMTYISQFRRVRGYRLSDINNHPITNWLYYQPVGYCEFAAAARLGFTMVLFTEPSEHLCRGPCTLLSTLLVYIYIYACIVFLAHADTVTYA